MSVATVVVAFALTTWQSDLVLEIVNAPLPDGREPITLGPTEPFLTTITNSAYAALLLSLPVLLYQAYAFLLPALSPRERRVALPVTLMVPVLFVAGVVFCFLLVLPPALDFLLSFNADEFNIELRAKDYYSFATLTMVAMGLGFQVPVGILALVRLGVVTIDRLRASRRHAILVIAILAALLPTIDPVTLLLEMVPLMRSTSSASNWHGSSRRHGQTSTKPPPAHDRAESEARPAASVPAGVPIVVPT